jgi:hypothetical protein
VAVGGVGGGGGVVGKCNCVACALTAVVVSHSQARTVLTRPIIGWQQCRLGCAHRDANM